MVVLRGSNPRHSPCKREMQNAVDALMVRVYASTDSSRGQIGDKMATISARPNGNWQAKVRRHGTTLSETFASKTAADAWARKQESEIERGLWRDSTAAERTLLREALERYGREKSDRKRGAVKEASVLRILSDEAIARKTLARIASADIASLVESWRRIGYVPSTIKRRLVVLSHLFETARREWGMETLVNPVKIIKLPPINDARERRVLESELDVVCRASRSSILAPVVRLAVETAMRRGEIVNLEWKHIDLGRRVARLPETKNGHPRDVPLSSRAVAVLESLPRPIRGGRVFDVREDAITQAFERACRRAGIEDLRFHDLRHEATSRLAEKLPVHDLAKVTGHRDLRMLMRYYHPRAEELARKIG